MYAKPPFSGPEAVLAYLSRYTHRVAISNRRLITLDKAGVTFRYKDYRCDGPNRQRTMTLSPDEFIRRFLLHVLPKGFHRIRHYGLLASAGRKANVARARELLDAPAPPAVSDIPLPDPPMPCPWPVGRHVPASITRPTTAMSPAKSPCLPPSQHLDDLAPTQLNYHQLSQVNPIPQSPHHSYSRSKSSNPHNLAPAPRGFVLGRFPYAGASPHGRPAMAGIRKPSPFRTFGKGVQTSRSQTFATCLGNARLRLTRAEEPTFGRDQMPAPNATCFLITHKPQPISGADRA